MSVLVTGSSGFIGRNLLKSIPFPNYVQSCDLPTCDIVKCNYYINSIQSVIHLAAETSVLNTSSSLLSTNILGTYNVLNAAKVNKVKQFIFASSMAVDSPVQSPYGISKKCGEDLCKLFTNDMQIDILRMSNVYGPYSAHKNSVVHKFIKQAILNEPLTIRGNGYQVRSFIYVKDVVDYIKSLIGKFSEKNPRYHTLSSPPISIKYLATTISEIFYSLTNKRPEITFIDALNEATFIPKASGTCHYPLEMGLEETIKWYLEHYNA